ncbi:tyrosine-type recombinase/integrase [Aeromicrobium sp. CTD01-1L150]|uniref:tyrosine-type recombinase/integrase n=1 Tax=Aeromicrobium sp. CTD01-1L150 TaxID=3341830 RepID=UPI0035BF0C14
MGAKQLGLPELRVHDLRHTAASLMLSSGASVVDIAAVLGHANSHTTLTVYAHLVGSCLDDVSTRLNRLLEAPYGQKAATDATD